jgi:DNA-binding MarR family transcriptional regulator
MNANNDEVLEVLREIRDILSRIYACFEDEYVEIQKQKLQRILTTTRKRIFPLLFDSRRLTQAEIAVEANTTQPTVSKFVTALLTEKLIEQVNHEDGSTTYDDKYGLVELLKETREADNE